MNIIVIIMVVAVVGIVLFTVSTRSTFNAECGKCREQIQSDMNECVGGVCPLKKK